MVWRTACSDRLEQRPVGLRVVEGLAGRVEHRDPALGNEEAHRPLHRFSRPAIHSPIARFSSRVVRISVTFGIVDDELPAAGTSSGTRVARAEVHHVERAAGADIGQARADDRAEAVLGRGKDAADQHVGDLGRRQVENAGEQAGIAERLHRAAAGAGGVEHQAVELALEVRAAPPGRRASSRRTWSARPPGALAPAALLPPALGRWAIMPASAWAALARTVSVIELSPCTSATECIIRMSDGADIAADVARRDRRDHQLGNADRQRAACRPSPATCRPSRRPR